MFEKYTDRARRVLVLAQDEARTLNHPTIGTEHILLGLLREGEGVAALALKLLGLSLAGVRAQVLMNLGQGTEKRGGHIPFTQRSKRVIELSLREALQLGHNYIGTEHVLLGLIREGEGLGAQIVVASGADLNQVRQKVVEIVSALQPPPPPKPIRQLVLAVTSAERALEKARRELAVAAADPNRL